jgi:hypothetical protein
MWPLQKNNSSIHRENLLMTTMTNTPNGRVRKSLAEQIDRLDRILDGLADGLNAAVAAAVQEAVGLAVRETLRSVLAEVVRNPDLLDRVRAAVAPQEQAVAALPPPLPGSTANFVNRVQARAAALWVQARHAGAQALVRAGRLVAQAAVLCRKAWQVRGRLLIAVGVGAAAAALTYCAGPTIASVAAGLWGFAATAAARTERWVQRLLPAYRALDS